MIGSVREEDVARTQKIGPGYAQSRRCEPANTVVVVCVCRRINLLLLCRCADGCTQLLFVQPTKQSHPRCEKVCSWLCVGMCAGVEGDCFGCTNKRNCRAYNLATTCFYVVMRLSPPVTIPPLQLSTEVRAETLSSR